ncbi:MAG: class I SAM-dependent methyltransferase [Acidimicrobiales bacterium]|nr:class I SAM-dependent methyltransferase [Acidimicrobiales bacterium]
MAVGDRERWNEKWSSVGVGTGHRSQLAELVAPWLPDRGTLLDVAGGGAPAAIAFAKHGLAVTVADVSDVGLQKAREEAALAGLEIDTVEVDLEAEPLPAGPWDVITVANYLQRELFPAMVEQLAAGGVLAVVIATETNLERCNKPGRPFLLDRDELPTLVPGLEILHHTEDWRDNGRHEAHLVARTS